MMDTSHLSKVLKDAMKGGKYTIGAKECISGIKGAKAVLFTRSIRPAFGAKLREEASKHHVTVVELPMTSAELGKMLGKQFNVSAMALRSVSEADVKQLLR